MALRKLKPVTPGQRGVVRVVNPDLHKGKPYAALLEKKTKTAGRNHHGRITTRHMGGGHKQHYRLLISSVTRTAFQLKLSVWSTILIVARIWHYYVMRMVSVATLSRLRVLRLAQPW